MSSGKEDLWVFISDPLHVDMKCYQFWLNGHSVSKTRQYLIDTYSRQASFQGVDPEDIGREASDQYRTFHLLEPYLSSPLSFEKHNFFHVDPSIVSELIERYFDFDATFMREMVGRRLSNKLRDHMDDVSERTHLKELSCLRQFDNLRRVYKKVISLNHTHPSSLPVTQMLQTNFRISARLARRYVRAIFLVYHRFEVKKKLSFMNFADFEFLAETLLPRWTAQHVRGQNADSELDQVFSIHLHPKLIDKLRDLKTLMSSTRDVLNDYANMVRQKLARSWEDQKKLKEVEHRLYSFLKLLLNTGATLSQPKQFRDFLSNAVEFIAEPCKRIELTYSEMEDVLAEIEACFHSVAESFTQMPERHRQQLQDAWLRFMEGMRLLILHFRNQFCVGEAAHAWGYVNLRNSCISRRLNTQTIEFMSAIMNIVGGAAPYLQIALGTYECLVWGINFKPYTFHPVTMTWAQRAVAIAINGLPHLVHGALQLKRGPRPFDSAIYLGGLAFFTSIQTYFWWIPYYFGIISDKRSIEFQEKLLGLVTWLPERESAGLIPDVEHTILFPLSVATLVSTATAFIRQRPLTNSRHSIAAIMTSFVLTALPGYQILGSQLPSEDRRGLSIAITNSIIVTSLAAVVNLWCKAE